MLNEVEALVSAQNLRIVTMPIQYGGTVPYTIASETFENSKWRLSAGEEPVTVLLPSELSDPVTVLFFSHGFGRTKWIGYRSLLTHLVSLGYAVVYLSVSYFKG